MHKELIMITLIVGLPIVFISYFEGFSSTGAIVNTNGELRRDRIQLYLSLPVPYEPVHRAIVDDVRSYLRAGSGGDFYYADRLKFGDQFFENEKMLVGELLKLVCLKPLSSPANGRFITPGKMDVVLLDNKYFGIPYQDLKKAPCDDDLRIAAEDILKKVMELDVALVGNTLTTSRCPELSVKSYDAALDDLRFGNYQSCLVKLQAAWNKASSCS